MEQAPGWELYRTALAVLREGSLSAAARALGLTQPTVGRHVDALERLLGPLFVRSQHGLAPTAMALAVRPHAEAMAASAAALLRAASSTEESGTVRITASEVIGAEVLPPILAGLREAHLGIAIELVLSNHADDLARREADIAVRMIRPAQEALLARRIGAVLLGLHASAGYLARHGMPEDEAALSRHTLIGFDQEDAFIRALRSRGVRLAREAFALRADSNLAQLALVRAGAGIGVCQTGIAARDGLVRVLPDRFAFELELWLAMICGLTVTAGWCSTRCEPACWPMSAADGGYAVGSTQPIWPSLRR